MLPLGDAWTGICRAVPDQPFLPGDSLLDAFCNLGYARGHCPRFPAGHGPDAVRFTIVSDDGAALRLYYVLERDHRPFAHGPLEFSVAQNELTTPAEGASDRRTGARLCSQLSATEHPNRTCPERILKECHAR